MKLLEIAKLLSLLDESIDIHGLAKLHKGNPEFEQAVKDYRASLQGRKKDLLKPFGLDDLDKFKENPEEFVKMVEYAMNSFKEQKEQNALYKKLYEDDKCLITMPKGPKGAAAAGSFCIIDGEVCCPWCVCVKYPENEKWWEKYDAATLAFVYAKEDGVVTDAYCMVLSARDALSVIVKGILAYSQVEGLENKGFGGNFKEQRKVLERLYGKTGLTDKRLVEILAPALKPRVEELRVIVYGDVRRVKEWLDSGADVDARDKEGKTLLLIESGKGHLEICKLLINAGADVNAKDMFEDTPLMLAAKHGRLEVCKLLIDAGAVVSAQPNGRLVPLHWAAAANNLEICKLLINAGADVNARDFDGETPLFLAASRGQTETCRLLIAAGADVDSATEYDWTPLVKAATEGYLETCKFLLDAGADINGRGGNCISPLFQASGNGHLEICKFLLDAGADLNARDEWGYTALHMASFRGYLEICKFLLDAGAVVDTVDKFGRNLLHGAAEASGDQVEICKLLIDAGVDVNARDKKGRTPLSIARKGHRKVEELLLQAGARG